MGISIILSTYNRINFLKKCVKALLEIDYNKYEIIIINDGSVDETEAFLNTLKDEKIKIIHNTANLGLSASRNIGIKKAQYDIVAFTDDDCLADKNWLTNLAKGFDSGAGFVIGSTFYINKDYKGYFPERLVSNPEASWPMGCNIAFLKEVFDTCGYFDDFFFKYNNEDSEMAIRAVSSGFLPARACDAIVYHQKTDWTIASLLRSARNASVWVLLKKKYPKHYLYFNPPVKFGVFISIKDYLYIIAFPAFIPFLFLRYLFHGKKNIKIFFIKWPVYLFLRRYYIYLEAIKNKVLML